MRVLVTGASGRIGRAICVNLARAHTVRGLDRAPSSTADWVGDLTDTALLAQAVEGIDAVVHVAALHAPHVGRVSEAVFEQINVLGTRRLLQAAQRAGVRHIVFTSTTAVFGAGADGAAGGRAAAWVTEAVEAQPRTVYHRTKLAAEQLLIEAARQGGPAVTVLRMARCFPEPAPMMAAYRLHRGADARDVAQAHALALPNPPPSSAVPHRTFIVSGATPFVPDDMPQLLNDAEGLLRQKAPALAAAFDARGWRLPASIDRVYSPAAIQAELGWQPRFGFEEVLREYDAWSSEVLPPEVSGKSPSE